MKRSRKVDLQFSEKVAVLLMMHFGSHLDGEHLSCYQCEDLKKGYCKGESRFDWKVIECMQDKAVNGEVAFSWP